MTIGAAKPAWLGSRRAVSPTGSLHPFRKFRDTLLVAGNVLMGEFLMCLILDCIPGDLRGVPGFCELKHFSMVASQCSSCLFITMG